jgi:hypothetical protein
MVQFSGGLAKCLSSRDIPKPNEREKMSTKATSKKVVVITAPKISSAYHAICDLTAKNDMNAEIAILKLANEMKKSNLSINDIKKVIKETKRESSVLKISQIEGLPTFADMNEKYEEFRALPLAKKLTKAAATYKLGVGKVEQLDTFAKVEASIKDFNQAKNHKAKSQPKTAKKTATTKQALESFRDFVNALNPTKLSETERDILADISLRLIELEDIAMAE